MEEVQAKDTVIKSLMAQRADCQLHTTYIWALADPESGKEVQFFRTATGDFVQKTEEGVSNPTVRSLGLAGALPFPEMAERLPEPFPGTMHVLLDEKRGDEPVTVRETVHRTIDKISYNGLQPFNKTAEELKKGHEFIEVKLDFRGEEDSGSTCIGMSIALLEHLHNEHGIEGPCS